MVRQIVNAVIIDLLLRIYLYKGQGLRHSKDMITRLTHNKPSLGT